MPTFGGLLSPPDSSRFLVRHTPAHLDEWLTEATFDLRPG